MFKKILQALMFKEVCQITVQQSFPIYRIDAETYTVIFLESILDRKVKVEGSKILERANLWIGTEFYVLTIIPWLNNLMTNKELREHLTLIRERCGNPEKIVRKPRDNNVVELSKWISSRSTEDQYEV